MSDSRYPIFESPDDLPVIERDAVRLIVQDTRGCILLINARDVTEPRLGLWWELPGGGIDDGENYLTAALRELSEETGIIVSAQQVGPPLWRRTATFRYRGVRRLQHEVVVLIELAWPNPVANNARQLDYEREDYLGFRWWSVEEIEASEQRFYPGHLRTLLRRFLAGEEIAEPFEVWS